MLLLGEVFEGLFLQKIFLTISANVGYTPHELTSLVAPCTDKIVKNGICVFEGGENLLYNFII